MSSGQKSKIIFCEIRVSKSSFDTILREINFVLSQISSSYCGTCFVLWEVFAVYCVYYDDKPIFIVTVQS